MVTDVISFVSRTENYEYLTPRLNRYVFQASGKAVGGTPDTVQDTYAREFLTTDS